MSLHFHGGIVEVKMTKSIKQIINELMTKFFSVEKPEKAKANTEYLGADKKLLMAKTGISRYRNADCSMRTELKYPDYVFDSELENLEPLPVTFDYKPKFVDASNIDKYVRGRIGDNCKGQNCACNCDYALRYFK